MNQKINALPQGVPPRTGYVSSDTNDLGLSCTQTPPGISTSSSRIGPLEEALRLTRGDRQSAYGHPTDDFSRTGALWTSLLGLPPGTITAETVALMMVLLKASREMNRHTQDNLVDMAGYVNCLNMILDRKQIFSCGTATPGPAALRETFVQEVERIKKTMPQAAEALDASKRYASWAGEQGFHVNPVHDNQEAI